MFCGYIVCLSASVSSLSMRVERNNSVLCHLVDSMFDRIEERRDATSSREVPKLFGCVLRKSKELK